MADDDDHHDLVASEPEHRDMLAAAAAFFRWRHAVVKASFKKQLEEILDDVADEEEASNQLRQQLEGAQRRLEESSQAMAKELSDQRTTLLHLDQLQAQNQELFSALEKAEGASRTHAEQARAAGVMHREEAAKRHEERTRASSQLSELQDQHKALASQQQSLLERLAERDHEVAEASQEALMQRREAQRLSQELERMEGILRATGERAATAEAQAAGRAETVSQLYAQLAALRERYHAELSELKAARMGAAEAQRMRQRLDSMQPVNDSLVAARDELRFTLDITFAKLASGEERLKRLGQAAGLRDAVVQALLELDPSDDSYIAQTSARLAAELELTQADATNLAERLAAADTIVVQQEGHIKRLATELAVLAAQLREADDMRQQQHRTNAELAAEMQRLAAEAALGPIMVLDVHGNLVPAEPSPSAPPAASAPATSQLEAQSTALRAILADKGFGLGALCQAIASKPGEVASVRQRLAQCRAGAEEVKAELGSLAELLLQRPVDGPVLEESLVKLLERVAGAEVAMVEAREGLAGKQIHAVTLEARLLAAESALRSAVSLLEGWSGLLAEAAATEGGSQVEPDIRLGLREELKSREDALHRATLDLAAAAPLLLDGDPGYAAVSVVVREAGSTMMELAVVLADRHSDAMAIRTRALLTEQALAEKAAHVARYRDVIGKLPGQAAEMVDRLTSIIPDVQGMAPALEEMLRVVRQYMSAGHDRVVDVAELQQEVLALRGVLRTKNAAIKELEAVGAGIRTASPSKRALKMVPIDALHAAERARDGVEAEKAALQGRLVTQRVRIVAARHRLIHYYAALRSDCAQAECFHKWRMITQMGKAERANTSMLEAQAEQARVEKEAAEAASRIAERKGIRTKALRRALKRMMLNSYYTLAVAVLYFWKLQARRQAAARSRWHQFGQRLREAEGDPELTRWDVWRGPEMTVARRLVQFHHADPSEFGTLRAVTGAQVARMALHAWRGITYVKQQARQVDALTEALPQWVAGIGDRRRLERGWLGWRLYAAGQREQRAEEAIIQAEAIMAQPSTHSVGVPASEPSGLHVEVPPIQLPSLPPSQAAEPALAAPMQASFGGEQARRALASVGGATPRQASISEGGGFGATSPPRDYLPNVHTVLAPYASAPAHTAAAEAVAAAHAAGLGLATQPLSPRRRDSSTGTTSLPSRRPSFTGAAHASFAHPTTETLTAYPSGFSGPQAAAIQPVAGPSEAQLSRRRVSMASVASTAGALGATGEGPSARSSSAGGRASAAPTRDPLRQVSFNSLASSRRPAAAAKSEGGAAAARAAYVQPSRTRSLSHGGSLARPAAATVTDHAQRLARAAEAISQRVHSAADALSPRTKQLQAAQAAAAAYAGPAEDSDVRPASPTRQLQADGTVAISYQAAFRPHGAPEEQQQRSPPRSPTRSLHSGAAPQASTGPPLSLEPSLAWQPSEQEQAYGLMPRPEAARPQPYYASAPQVRHPSPQPPWPGPASTAGGSDWADLPEASQNQPGTRPNGLDILLSRLPGRFDPVRDEPRPTTRVVPTAAGSAAAVAAAGRLTAPAPSGPGRPYGHIGSRLREETVSTIAKKRLPGKPERGIQNLTALPPAPYIPVLGPMSTHMAPTNTTPGPLVASQLTLVGGRPTMADLSAIVRAGGFPGPMPMHDPQQQQQQPVRHAWPHLPADQLAPAGPHTSDPLLLPAGRQAPYHATAQARPAEPMAAHTPAPAPAFGGWPGSASTSAGQQSAAARQPDAAAPGGGAGPPAPKAGKVVRFERATPGPSPTASQSEAAGAGGRQGAEGPTEAGPVTYIRLPSPVRVSIRLQP